MATLVSPNVRALLCAVSFTAQNAENLDGPAIGMSCCALQASSELVGCALHARPAMRTRLMLCSGDCELLQAAVWRD